MRVVVIQSNYIPWKGYFDLIHDADVFCFYDEVQYTKNDWRNRNKIYSKNGLQWITIPIHKDAVRHKISEVELPLNWQKDHYKILQLSYSNAPYYSQLKELMDEFYLDFSCRTLSEFNQYSIKKIALYIGITTKFVNSADYNLKEGRMERLISLLVELKATEYISGPTGKDYLADKIHMFSDNGIAHFYKMYDYKPYKQLSEPFENYVSIFDLIANVERSQIKNYIWNK